MKYYKRESYLQKIRGFCDDAEIIKVITGVRRCGKSSLMQTIVEEILEKGIAEENIIFLNLDKRGYRNIKTPEQLENQLMIIQRFPDLNIYSSMKFKMSKILN